MLKLGGEMFGGGKVGIDPDVVENVARQIAEVSRQGIEIAVVIGGGNSSAARSFPSAAWIVLVRTTWACWAR